MRKPVVILIAAFQLFILSCSQLNTKERNPGILQSGNYLLREDFKAYFDRCSVEGSIAIYHLETKQWILSDTTSVFEGSLPASTFKILNLLIALETGVIADENEIIVWPGNPDTVLYGYRPDIYHDMTVKEAFKVSAGWAFIELAKKIGKENYRKYLEECDYGNLDLSREDPDFWNFGDFAISPVNQAEFITKLCEGQLPFSERNMDIVKEVMVTERNDSITIRSKTGWSRDKGINNGWWTGYAETEKGTFIFATRLQQDRKVRIPGFGKCRIEITKRIMEESGVIGDGGLVIR